MIRCPITPCPGVLRVTHTYSAPEARYQRAVCKGCGKVFTVTSLISIEPVAMGRHGAAGRRGAQTKAQKAVKAAGLQPQRLGGPWPTNGRHPAPQASPK